MKVDFVLHHGYAVLPTRATPGSTGYDLSSIETCVVPAKGKALINTGLSMKMKFEYDHCYARIAPRSGISWKKHIDVGAGVIDEDYRGEIKVLLFNHSDEDFIVNVQDKIAQLIFEKIYIPELEVVETLSDSDNNLRGVGGFGSTGK